MYKKARTGPKFSAIKFILLFYVAFFNCPLQAQSGSWIWVNGSDTMHTKPVFGKKGVADINNNPGARALAANWLGNDGSLWLFGGYTDTFKSNGLSDLQLIYSDVWKYEPSVNMWTWVSGPDHANAEAKMGVKYIPSDTNNPGVSQLGNSSYWKDKNGDFWIYNYETNFSHPVIWKYETKTKQWAWMWAGDSTLGLRPHYGQDRTLNEYNSPGGRFAATSNWVDSNNNLWLYGGIRGSNDSIYNDVWCFNTSVNSWAHMNGSKRVGLTSGDYGERLVERASNIPPSRLDALSWTDGRGKMYLFGGRFGKSVFNDLWCYNTTSNCWVWLAGDSTPNQNGLYQVYCSDSIGEPKGRWFSSMGCGKDQRFAYLFGGLNYGYGVDDRGYDDLWLFDMAKLKWKWVCGTSQAKNIGHFGIHGVQDNSNQIPGRYGHCQWIDCNGVLWIFGGITGNDIYIPHHKFPCKDCPFIQKRNDLWKFIPDKSCIKIEESGSIYTPNSFSPNGDNINDHFTIYSSKIVTSYTIKVYDRWGEVVYDSSDVSEINDPTRGWDGRYKENIQNGVFLYHLCAMDYEGVEFNKTGSITILK